MRVAWNKGLNKETDERINKYSNSLKSFYLNNQKPYIPNIVKRICPKCGKEFEIDLNKTNRKYCSRSCANGHKHSEETKLKISKGVNKHNKLIGKFEDPNKLKENLHKLNNRQLKIVKKQYCLICGSEKGKCPRPDVCKRYRLFNSLVKFGFNLETKSTLEIIDEFDKVKQLVSNIYNEHPTNDDLIKYNYYSGLSNFHKVIKSLGLQTKTCSEAQRESILLGKAQIPIDINSLYKQCWYTTWENKQVFLRSSYELEYAKFLDENKIKYNVEKLRIKYFDSSKNIERIAIPDFYLIESNTIVEIKSSWTLNIQNMKDKFNKYFELGYKTKLILNHKEVDLYSL